MGRVIYLQSAHTSRYLTVEEAAERLAIRPPVVRNYLSSGRLTTFKFKTLTLLSSGEVQTYQRSRARNGDPSNTARGERDE